MSAPAGLAEKEHQGTIVQIAAVLPIYELGLGIGNRSVGAGQWMTYCLPTWRQMNRDTSPEAEAILVRLWRETPAWRKWELMEDLSTGRPAP